MPPKKRVVAAAPVPAWEAVSGDDASEVASVGALEPDVAEGDAELAGWESATEASEDFDNDDSDAELVAPSHGEAFVSSTENGGQGFLHRDALRKPGGDHGGGAVRKKARPSEREIRGTLEQSDGPCSKRIAIPNRGSRLRQT